MPLICPSTLVCQRFYQKHHSDIREQPGAACIVWCCTARIYSSISQQAVSSQYRCLHSPITGALKFSKTKNIRNPPNYFTWNLSEFQSRTACKQANHNIYVQSGQRHHPGQTAIQPCTTYWFHQREQVFPSPTSHRALQHHHCSAICESVSCPWRRGRINSNWTSLSKAEKKEKRLLSHGLRLQFLCFRGEEVVSTLDTSKITEVL